MDSEIKIKTEEINLEVWNPDDEEENISDNDEDGNHVNSGLIYQEEQQHNFKNLEFQSKKSQNDGGAKIFPADDNFSNWKQKFKCKKPCEITFDSLSEQSNHCKSAQKNTNKKSTSKKIGSSNEGPKCEICSKKFYKMANLKKHLKAVHQIDEMPQKNKDLFLKIGEKKQSKNLIVEKLNTKFQVNFDLGLSSTSSNRLNENDFENNDASEDSSNDSELDIENISKEEHSIIPPMESTSDADDGNSTYANNETLIFMFNNQSHHRCQYCQKNFISSSTLDLHLQSEHNTNDAKSLLSKKISEEFVKSKDDTNPQEEMEIIKSEIIETNNDDKMHKCHICDLEFDQYQLEIHFLTSHSMDDEDANIEENDPLDIGNENLKSVSIENAEKIFKPKTTFHFESGSSTTSIPQAGSSNDTSSPNLYQFDTFKCETCSKIFWSNDALKNHTKEIHPIKNYCDICKKEFHNKAALVQHKKCHKKPKNLTSNSSKCEYCFKNFNNSLKLKTHIWKVHQWATKHDCLFCKKSFDSLNDLKEHLENCEEPNRFKCKCGKKFSHYSNLLRHKKMENDGKCNNAIEKCHKCNQCDRNFKFEKDLNNHQIKSHNRPKIKCQNCELEFMSNVALKKHTKEKHPTKHYCKICSREFCNKNYLNIHMKNIHEGVKNFKCSFCDRAYSQSNELQRHISKIHDGQKYKCQQCDKIYFSKTELKKCKHKNMVYKSRTEDMNKSLM